jgi:hypothetical protein
VIMSDGEKRFITLAPDRPNQPPSAGAQSHKNFLRNLRICLIYAFALCNLRIWLCVIYAFALRNLRIWFA